MRVFKRIVLVLEILIIMCVILFGYFNKKAIAQVIPPFNETPIKIDVLLYDFNDKYISLVRQNFEDIQRNSQGKVEFTFYDGMSNQSIQSKDVNEILGKGDTNLILLNIVDITKTKSVIDRIKEKGIPVILFNREPLNMEDVKSYNKAFFVGTNAAEAGILQGQILINTWNTNKNIDTNNDNIMQYVMLMGERNNIEAIERTRYSVLTTNDGGIRTNEIALRVANWDRNLARIMMEALYLQQGRNIEVIIANNDEMAIGAIQALQKYGYNTGDNSKTIPVVGVDAIPEAQELIKRGIMTGSVLQDAQAMAEVTYNMGINLVYGRNPLNGIPYEFDSTGVSVRLPYRELVS